VITCAAIVAWALQSTATCYEVYGLVDSTVVWVGVIIGAIASVPLLSVLRGRTIVILWMIALVAFALSQTVHTNRLAALRSEVAAIISYVDDYKLQHGLYPTDLSGYEFQRPVLAEYVEYHDAFPTTSYSIRWHPTHREDISHYYGADYGHYYEDD
jgi:hypothetical protein